MTDSIDNLLAEIQTSADPDTAADVEIIEQRFHELRAENEELRAKTDTQHEEIEALQSELEKTTRGTLELASELEERYQQLFQSAVEGIYTTTETVDQYTMANPAFADLLGYESGEKLCDAIDSIENEVFVDQEQYGTYVDTLVSDGELQQFEYQIRTADGEVRWVSDSISPIHNADGTIEGYRGGVIDITEQKQAELERAERERALRHQTDQMEFFNSILRHDVLNGMTVIRGRAGFLTDELEGQQLQDAETIVEWSNDIVTIIQRVRAILESLTGDEDMQLEPCDLSAALRSEVNRVQTTYPDVEFHTDIADSVTVQANELLGEVLGNVITNAITHNETSDLRVSVSVEEPDEAGDPVTILIADNGSGIPEEDRGRIFRRNETGHAKTTGSGFGLFFVDSMLDNYDGNIRVEDNEPQGAAFVIELSTP